MEWRSTKLEPQGTWAELPLVLNIGADNNWFIFTIVSINEACAKYSKYQFSNGVWSEIPLPVDIETHRTNLSLAAGSNRLEGLIAVAEKDEELIGYRYLNKYKNVGPKKYVCMGGYNGPYPPIEKPLDCKKYPGHRDCQKRKSK